jgi:hypothetical protein
MDQQPILSHLMHILPHWELAQSNNFCAHILLILNPLVERRQRHLTNLNFFINAALSWGMKTFSLKLLPKTIRNNI